MIEAVAVAPLGIVHQLDRMVDRQAPNERERPAPSASAAGQTCIFARPRRQGELRLQRNSAAFQPPDVRLAAAKVRSRAEPA